MNSATQDVYICLQTNEITRSLVVWVALNKWPSVVEKGCRLLGVFGSGWQGVNKKNSLLHMTRENNECTWIRTRVSNSTFHKYLRASKVLVFQLICGQTDHNLFFPSINSSMFRLLVWLLSCSVIIEILIGKHRPVCFVTVYLCIIMATR